jgi:hypothetical protein
MLTLAFSDGEAPGTGRKVNEWLNDRGERCAQAFYREDLHWIDWMGLGVFAFSAGTREVRVWPEAEAQPEAIIDTFSRILQPLILQALGWQALHAGAAVGPAGVFAFCGKKYCGKSTLAFAMHQAGWRHVADDALVLRVDRNRVMACPLPFTPRLRPASRAHFAHALVSLPPSSGPQRAEIPLSAVFLLQQDARLTCPRARLMPQAQVFSKLLAHAHCFDTENPKHTRQLVDDYLDLAARVPVFALEYRPDFEQLPQLVRTVIEAAASIDVKATPRSECVL